MTDPLIDKAELLRLITHEFDDLADPVGAADSVIGYLRSVLTPEALRVGFGRHIDDEGTELHRRIFGEEHR